MTTLAFDAPADPILERRRPHPGRGRGLAQAAQASARGSPSACAGCFLVIAIVPLVAVVVYVVVKGLPGLERGLLHQARPYPEGIPGGGVWNAIVGTVVIAAIATAVAVPVGLLCGLFLAESDGRIAAAIRFTADVMTGVPSITIGIFGYIAIVRNFGTTAAWPAPSPSGSSCCRSSCGPARRPSGACPVT